MTFAEIMGILYRAQQTENGLVLKVTDEILQTRQAIYDVKTKCGDERLRRLSLHISPDNPNELWIIPPDALPKHRGRKVKEAPSYEIEGEL